MRAHTPEIPSILAPLPVRAPALAAIVADDDDPEDAASWAGRLTDGWTSEELNVALPALSAVVGVELAVLWEYQDQWGFGGDSELVAVTEDGSLAEPPVGVQRYLVDGDVPLASLGRTAGPLRIPNVHIDELPSAWGANLAPRYAPDAQLG